MATPHDSPLDFNCESTTIHHRQCPRCGRITSRSKGHKTRFRSGAKIAGTLFPGSTAHEILWSEYRYFVRQCQGCGFLMYLRQQRLLRLLPSTVSAEDPTQDPLTATPWSHEVVCSLGEYNLAHESTAIRPWIGSTASEYTQRISRGVQPFRE